MKQRQVSWDGKDWFYVDDCDYHLYPYYTLHTSELTFCGIPISNTDFSTADTVHISRIEKTCQHGQAGWCRVCGGK